MCALPSHANPRPAAVYFPLTVDSRFSGDAQALLRRECRDHIRSISLEVLPGGDQVRLWVTLAAVAYGLALHAVIMCLPAAEFGRVGLAKGEGVEVRDPASLQYQGIDA